MAAKQTTEQSKAQLIAAAPELLQELEHAHRIIQTMVNMMTDEQKFDLSTRLDGDDFGGVLRHHTRKEAIAKAQGRVQ